LQQRQIERLRHFFGQHGLAGTRLALDQQRALQRNRGVDRQHQVLRGDVVFGTLEFHE